MTYNYLSLTNELLVRLNEPVLTSANFTSSRGIQTQAKSAINSAIRHVNQSEFSWPFNHNTESVTVSPGKVRYTSPSSFKTIDYNTFRIRKNGDGNEARKLSKIDYTDYIDQFFYQEDTTDVTALNGSHTNSVTTITVTSTTAFDSTGNIQIADEVITYTGTTSTTFTGCTRGASSTTAVAYSSAAVVTQFSGGGVPTHVFRTPDNNYGLYPYPNKTYLIDFEYFSQPIDLSATTDAPTIPEAYLSTLVDGAMYYLYQYRQDNQTAALSLERFESGIKNMRTLLINSYDYVRSHYHPRTSGGSSMGSRYNF
tara:strand:- start:1064 stop:1996 length:933 start_codon:yes stop_codon:yes gene_type:complete